MLLIISCAILCLYLWTTRRQNKYEPPSLPGRLPLIGHAYILLGDSVKLWNTVKKYSIKTTELGGVAKMWMGPTKFYVVTDPEDYATVVNKCLKKNRFYEFGRPWLGQGLVTGTLEKYKVHRRLLNPAFNQAVLNKFIDIFNSQSRRLVQSLEDNIGKGPFDHLPCICHNALETICLTAIGVDFTDKAMQNSGYVVAIEKMLNIIVDRIQHLWFHYDFIFNLSPTKKKQDKYLKILHHVSNTALRKRKEHYLNNKNVINEERTEGTRFKPFMDLILELSIEKKLLNDTEIREHVDTIIAAGHDTIAAALVYTILLIGSIPDVQEKIVEEQKNVFGDNDSDVMKQDLSKLIYLEAVIKESLRFYTVAPVTARLLDTDVKLRNCTLLKGHTCLILAHGIHRHPMWGPDAEEFIPERWLDPAKLPEVPSAYAPFNIGKRSCIGKLYAYMSMKVTLSHVFRNYKISGDHTKSINKVDCLLKPVSGHHIVIERRK